MANVIRKLRLSRRAVLRGAGSAIALPWLSAMAPALTPRADAPVRACFIFFPNGVKMDDWTPEGEGRGYRFGHTLDPLEPYRDQVSVFSGLAIDGGRAHGDGPGDHARNASTYLTCVHPRKTGGRNIRAGVSVDQLIAKAVGRTTRFASLELGLEGGRLAGVCDSGYACAYSNNVSWRSPTTPVPKEIKPKEVFRRLFGDPTELVSGKERLARAMDRRSILDFARDDARRLLRRLGGAARAKLTQYLDSIREVERRLTSEMAEDAPVDDVPVHLLGRDRRGYESRLGLMYDLIAIAFETDLTRTVTLMLGNAGSNRSYRMAGVSEGHHTLSHHKNKASMLADIRRIDRWHGEQFARFIGVLDGKGEPGASLLRQSMVMFGSGIGDGNRHDHMRVPVLVAGGGGGRLKPGRHQTLARHTPMANLHLAIMSKLGLKRASFADSTGALDI